MRNVDAEDGSRVMMDEKNVWEFFWMRNMDAKGWFTSYDGWELWMRSMFENDDGWEIWFQRLDEKYEAKDGWKNYDGW
jgi:hypothetical protein